MKKYKVIKLLTLRGGVVELDEKQAERRISYLDKVTGKGLYSVSGVVSFKIGEVIGIKDVPKWLLQYVEAIPVRKKATKKKK